MVVPIHLKAMPVIVTTPKEHIVRLNASTEEPPKLQRLLPDDMLMTAGEGEKSDKAA
jgi:hypothetical protein